MPPDDAPSLVVLPSPDARVPKDAAHDGARDLDDEPRTKRDDRNVDADPPNPKLLGLVLEHANGAGSVGGEILRLGPEPPVGPGEEEILVDQPIEGGQVTGELRRSDLRLERDDFRITAPAQDGLERTHVHGGHAGTP